MGRSASWRVTGRFRSAARSRPVLVGCPSGLSAMWQASACSGGPRNWRFEAALEAPLASPREGLLLDCFPVDWDRHRGLTRGRVRLWCFARLELPHQSVGLGDLLRRHPLCQLSQLCSGDLIALRACEAEPLVSFHAIFGHALATLIVKAEGVLGHRMSLFGGFAIPRHGLH